MKVPIEEALRRVACSIVAENKSAEEWAALESDDMFQEEKFVGGFDSTEGEFCFSYYGSEGEIWFQLSLEQIREIAEGGSPEITGCAAES